MRTSFFTRSAVVIATLAVGSVALAATPATATSPEVVTRDLVLAVAQQTPSYQTISDEAVRLAELTCKFEQSAPGADSNGDYFHYVRTAPIRTANVTGVLVSAELYEPSTEDGTTDRQCTFAALASTDAAFTLSGNAVVTTLGSNELRRSDDSGDLTATTPLSGNLTVTEPINADEYSLRTASLAATGLVSGPVNVTTTEYVKTLKPRTAAGGKAAKAKYTKRLAEAKKWYAKALKKAGGSKSKKAAAKKSYASKKAAYKKAYEKRYATVVPVTKSTVQTGSRPFDVSASVVGQLG